MFTKERPKHQLLLEDELVQQLKLLRTHVSGSDEFVRTLTYVERLHQLMDKKPSSVSNDTWATIGANLLGIVLIIKHEHVNVITSKAMSFIPRLK